MTDPDLQKKNPANPEQASEPVVSKPYIMPDDPDPASVEAMAMEVA
jgi:molecular chaperone GrpE